MNTEIELTKEQYTTLWKMAGVHTSVEEIDTRFAYWDKVMFPKYGLEYIEIIDDRSDTPGDYPYAWFGVVRGEQKNLNWFFLSL